MLGLGVFEVLQLAFALTMLVSPSLNDFLNYNLLLDSMGGVLGTHTSLPPNAAGLPSTPRCVTCGPGTCLH